MQLDIQGLTDLGGPALFVGFHPDDLEFHASGLAALLSQAGINVIYLVATSGEGRGDAKIREKEQLASADVVGVSDVIFLRCKDGSLFQEYQKGRLQKRLAHEIRKIRPSVIVSFCPNNLCTITWGAEHPDHRYGALALWDAIYPSARQDERRSLKEFWRKSLLPGHQVSRVLWFGDDLPTRFEANCFVSVNEVWLRVEKALSLHKSQWDEADIKRKSLVRAGRAALRWEEYGLVEEYHQIVFD